MTEQPVMAPPTYVVDRWHPAASDSGAGTKAQPFETIGRAAERARPGETILVRAGVYRERVAPARGGEKGGPITYRAAPGETVVIRGSEVWAPEWRPAKGRGAIFTGALDPFLFGDYNPFLIPARRLPGKKTLGQVFADGEPLTEVDTEETLHAVLSN